MKCIYRKYKSLKRPKFRHNIEIDISLYHYIENCLKQINKESKIRHTNIINTNVFSVCFAFTIKLLSKHR